MFLGDGGNVSRCSLYAFYRRYMSDVTLLGVIAAGLGMYCLHLQWKLKLLLSMTQVVFAGIAAGEVAITRRDGRYIPVSKQEQDQA